MYVVSSNGDVDPSGYIEFEMAFSDVQFVQQLVLYFIRVNIQKLGHLIAQ